MNSSANFAKGSRGLSGAQPASRTATAAVDSIPDDRAGILSTMINRRRRSTTEIPSFAVGRLLLHERRFPGSYELAGHALSVLFVLSVRLSSSVLATSIQVRVLLCLVLTLLGRMFLLGHGCSLLASSTK